MISDKMFNLSEEQKNKLSAWMEQRAKAAWEAGVMESHSIEVTFTFHSLGRDVTAKVTGSSATLEIEDSLEGF